MCSAVPTLSLNHGVPPGCILHCAFTLDPFSICWVTIELQNPISGEDLALATSTQQGPYPPLSFAMDEYMCARNPAQHRMDQAAIRDML
jgi:hypothetical protein